ncbi:MAG: OmpA/MotB family protein [Nitrospinales bacterium]
MTEKPQAHESDDFEDPQNIEGADEGLAPWVITFADLVTLLLVFFVLLFAIGTIEEKKWRKVKKSLRMALVSQSLNPDDTQSGLDIINQYPQTLDEKTISAVDEVGALVAKEIKDIAAEVDEYIYQNKLEGQIAVSSDTRGAVITISDVVLFPLAKAEMTPEGRKTVRQIFDLLKQFHYHIKVEGHTDNSPIKTIRFPSNWELSASRASNVARMLIEHGIPPDKISVEGFAEFRPKVPNDSVKNRAVNRRIEVVYQRGSIRKRMVDILRKTKSRANKSP